jgi:hypothetical protein
VLATKSGDFKIIQGVLAISRKKEGERLMLEKRFVTQHFLVKRKTTHYETDMV